MSDTFEFIDAEYAARTTATPSVTRMCSWLDVSRSGFYEWRGRAASATVMRRGELAELVRRSFTASDGTYGYRRVHAVQLVTSHYRHRGQQLKDQKTAAAALDPALVSRIYQGLCAARG